MANVSASSEKRREQEARAVERSNLAIYKRLQVGARINSGYPLPSTPVCLIGTSATWQPTSGCRCVPVPPLQHAL